MQTSEQNNLVGMLEEAVKEASQDGWKGPNSKAVTQETYLCAKRFLESLLKCLPEKIPNPEIAAESDGDIDFEWYKDLNQFLSVSVGLNKLNYAGCFGKSYCGKENFFETSIPQIILDRIYELY